MKKERIFYIYLDWTTETIPRVFYVGKGNDARIKNSTRNNYWTNISIKYGWRREVILGSRDENFVLELEQDLIKQFKTFEADWPDGSGWGANFTRGGDGISGFKLSKEAKNKISLSKMGDKNPSYGKTPSEETKLKMSISRSGENNPFYGKFGPEHPIYGNKHSAETKEEMSIAARGEKNNMAKLTWDEVDRIRELLATNKYSHREIANMFNISRSLVGLILNNKRWAKR